jgi:hypothetical protein
VVEVEDVVMEGDIVEFLVGLLILGDVDEVMAAAGARGLQFGATAGDDEVVVAHG